MAGAETGSVCTYCNLLMPSRSRGRLCGEELPSPPFSCLLRIGVNLAAKLLPLYALAQTLGGAQGAALSDPFEAFDFAK